MLKKLWEERKDRKGFTLPELMVVLVILTIVLAVAIPTATHYIKLAEFRKNEENAKTIYMAAETALTQYRSSGQWEDFRREVVSQGKENTGSLEGVNESGRIYAITLDRGAYSAADAQSSNLVERLIGNMLYDADMLSSGATAIEIDIEAGEVYSAFYGTRCSGLDYRSTDEGGILTMNDRIYESRRQRLLGYYSVDDVTNVVDLEPTRLKVSSIQLLNSETLSLNWSSNSKHDNLDVKFQIDFYDKNAADAEKLFGLTVDRSELSGNGWSGNNVGAASMAVLTLTVPGEGESPQEEMWTFPLTYKEGSFSLVLDGMMSADAKASLDAKSISQAEAKALARSSSVSITRLAQVAEILAEPADIYATVQAFSTYRNMEGDMGEYRESTPVSSNVANTLYANGTKVTGDVLEAQISTFRHLSNIRYYDPEEKAEFTMTVRNMNWNSSSVGVYGYESASGREVLKLGWQENTGELNFPSIELLSKNHTLTGRSNIRISNLYLGTESVADDAATDTLGLENAAYVGLFGEADGLIKNLILYNPQMIFAQTQGAEGVQQDNTQPVPAADFGHIRGLGILAGRSSGKLEDISVVVDKPKAEVMIVALEDRSAAAGYAVSGAQDAAAAGCIAGILAEKDNGGALSGTPGLSPIAEGTVIKGLEANGTVRIKLPAPAGSHEEPERAAQDYCYGIGGLFGYASLESEGARIIECANHANVSGNLFTGGIVGHVEGFFDADGGAITSANAARVKAQLLDCENDGLILCNADHEEEEKVLDGRYFGGLAGYAHKTLISGGESAAGTRVGYTFESGKKEELLKGQYVGGILGFGSDSMLVTCRTGRNGYILGADYVGGIVGGLMLESGSVSGIGGGVDVTTNASYVIGNRYVGGIIGKNGGTNRIQDCINNGIAAGYDAYIGGIAGYNDTEAEILDCASYLSDYSGAIFDRLVNEWKTEGNFAGGLAGYNNGQITFTAESERITVKSVSSIVVGKDYVGGVVGLNDKNGKLDVDYTLIGGRVYAYGDCAGGCIGLNASTEVLKTEIVVKPTSVRGRYCVGGIIGANALALESDLTIDGLRIDNRLGTLTARGFAGGLIGYQRTYTPQQFGFPAEGTVRGYIEKEENKGKLLPVVDGETNIPAGVEESRNIHTLTLTLKGNGNTIESLTRASNNMPVYALGYVGGLVGYCEKGTRLVIKNCKNIGLISRASALEYETAQEGVKLYQYLKASGYTDAAESMESGDKDSLKVDMAGGIIGVNLTNQVIDNCVNTGNLTGFTCLGGIAGVNGGGIFNCELSESFGAAGLDYLGGIVGLNFMTENQNRNYTDVKGVTQTYFPGTVTLCRAKQGITVTGQRAVGGIVGYNLYQGMIRDNFCQADVYAASDYAGGIGGRNAGTILAGEDQSGQSRSVTGQDGQGIGGLVGYNEAGGVIRVSGTGRVVAVGRHVSVTGKEKIGGVVGINKGSFGTTGGAGSTGAEVSGAEAGMLICLAETVHATGGYAGGIAGDTEGNISNAEYISGRSGQVTADNGPAGGIVPVNRSVLSNCINKGNVNSNQGYAGGIAAENYGTITSCTVVGRDENDNPVQIMIRSRKTDELGAVCSLNHAGAVVEKSTPAGNVQLNGGGSVYSAVAGKNQGTVRDTQITYMPEIKADASSLTVGGAAGINELPENVGRDSGNGLVSKVAASENFERFSGYRYLGGVAGENRNGAVVSECSYGGRGDSSSSMSDVSSLAGSCYGGIAGLNSGTLTECTLYRVNMDMQGVYTAISTSTAAQKEAMSTHIGGIAGKNEESGRIERCYLDSSATSSIRAKYGMTGGIAGYNKGMISRCGDSDTAGIMAAYTSGESVDKLCADVSAKGYSVKKGYVAWGENGIENLSYNGGGSVFENKVQLVLSENGNLGGITAYNSPAGELEFCATGDWFLNNKSDNILGVGTGGIIGMNESEQDMSFLLNRAFVGRERSKNLTNCFAGGIIGNQSNLTSEGWTLSKCVNYGTIYCYHTHYSGGIIGQWTGTGGNIENCRNYGNLQTTYSENWRGAAGGIVAQLYHAYGDNTYNIISCGNFGSIFGQNGGSENSANDSAGILGNVTAYHADSEAEGDSYTIQVLDCVNGPGVEVYSNSMASGIVGFFSCDNPGNGSSQLAASTANIKLAVERCRNYAVKLYGNTYSAGILGDRYGQTGAKNTKIYDCYSVRSNNYRPAFFPIISFNSNGSMRYVNNIKAKGNFFFEDVRSFTYPVIGASGTIDYSAGTVGPNTRRAQTNRAHLVEAGGAYYAVYTAYNTNYDASGIQFEEHNILSNDSGKIGYSLFTTQGEKFGANSDVTGSGSNFDTYVRESYRRIEGIMQDQQKMEAPVGVSASLESGRIHILITPGPNRDPRAGITVGDVWNESENQSDPFKYEVSVYVGGVLASTNYLYSEEGNVDLPQSSVGGAISVKVRAVSMYDDIAKSDEVSAGEIGGKIILPAPDIRAEIVKKDDSGALCYQISLNNLEEYDSYPGWRVKLSIAGEELSKSSPTVKIEGNSNPQQILAQAHVPGNAVYIDSVQVSVPVFMPDTYKPDTALKEDGAKPVAKPGILISGKTLNELSIQASLTNKGGSINTPPIYGVDLIGTWKDGKDAVLSSSEILVTINGTAQITLPSLPDYVIKNPSDMPDLKVRVWFKGTGLGPVYTYHELSAEEFDGHQGEPGYYRQTTGLNENGDLQYAYAYSEILARESADYASYIWESGTLTWISSTVLFDPDSDVPMTPAYDADGKLTYTFYWGDKETTPGELSDQNFQVDLEGIDENGSNLIKTDQAVIKRVDPDRDVSDEKLKDSLKQFMTDNQCNCLFSVTVSGEEWKYNKVKLSVTHYGDPQSLQIGLTTTGSYKVRKRLDAPILENNVINVSGNNELQYKVEWKAIAQEADCDHYQLYVSSPSGVLSDPLPEPVKAGTGQSGIYSQTVDLEEYAGEDVLFYVAAIAKEDSGNYVNGYVNSKNSAKITFSVPKRIDPPDVEYKLEPDSSASCTISEFESGGLTAVMTPKPDSSRPASGSQSQFLMRAYVFDTAASAGKAVADEKSKLQNQETFDWEALTTEQDGYLCSYPAEAGEVVTFGVSGDSYRHTITGLKAEYAGKYVVFRTRISTDTTNNISSKWVTYETPVQLPKVKLNDVEPGADLRNLQCTVEEKPQAQPNYGVTNDLILQGIICEWDSAAYADTYHVKLTPKTGSEYQFKIKEEKADGMIKVLDQGDSEIGEIVLESADSCELSGYQNHLTGNYNKDGIDYQYQADISLRLEAKPVGEGIHYTLVLPDVKSVIYNSTPVGSGIITDSVWVQTDSDQTESFVPSDGVTLNGFSDGVMINDMQPAGVNGVQNFIAGTPAPTPTATGSPMPEGTAPTPTGSPMPEGTAPMPTGSPMSEGTAPTPTGTPMSEGTAPTPTGSPMPEGAAPVPSMLPAATAASTPVAGGGTSTTDKTPEPADSQDGNRTEGNGGTTPVSTPVSTPLPTPDAMAPDPGKK